MIDILEAGNFRVDRIAAQLMDEDGIHPFLEAATLGSLSEVKGFLDSGVDADTRYGSDQLSALDVAVLMGHLEVVRALLEQGVDVNGVNSLGETALHIAVFHNRAHADVVDLLLSAGANIDALTIEGSTALHFAVLFPGAACSDIVATLLQRKAAKDAVSANGFPPLHLAARHGNLTATRALLAAGADANLSVGDGMLAPLNVAAWHGQVEVIKELVRHGVNVDAAPEASGCTALHQAAWKNQAGAVDALVEAGASVTAQTADSGSTPLHMAAEYLALEALRALLRHGAPVRAWRRGDGVGRSSEPPLHYATQQGGKKGAAEVVELLLRWGADEFELDDDGNTAAEVLGADVSQGQSLAGDADRVRELLANAPADRAWRRRGLLLLCLARDPRRRRRRGGSGGEGKGTKQGAEQGAEQGVERRVEQGAERGVEQEEAEPGAEQDTGQRAEDEGEKGAGHRARQGVEAGEGVFVKDGDGGAGVGSGAVPSLDCISVPASVTATEGRGKCERTPSKAARFGKGRDCSNSGCGRGGRGNSENGGGLDGVVASLLEIEEEGLFRMIVRFL